MRRLISPRWLVIHAIAIALVLLFVVLGWWQLHRAEGGNTRSYAYALEWPSFALLVIGFWLKTMRDEVRRGGDAAPAAEPSGYRDEAAAELAAYNRFMAERSEARAARDGD